MAVENIPNCKTGAAFMKLGDGGAAPILNYSLPQKSSFTTYGNVVVRVESNKFINPAQNALIKKLVAMKGMEAADLRNKIVAELTNGSVTSSFLSNMKLADHKTFVKKIVTIDTVETPEKTVAQVVTPPPSDVPNVYGQAVNVPQIKSQLATEFALDNNLQITGRIAKKQGVDIDEVVAKIAEGYVPMLKVGLNAKNKRIVYHKRPTNSDGTPKFNPMLFVIEEYKTASYLGDYGAGKTVKTFSLLPGEKTTITIKSFTEKTETKSESSSILDSFSEESATEMENFLEEEYGEHQSNSTEEIEESSNEKSLDASVDLSLGGVGSKITGISAHASVDSHTASTDSSFASATAVREANANSLSSALEKHNNKTNSNREMTINTENQTTVNTQNETSTVRELYNPNQSRTLNFVFRQLLQEYVTITYLENIKIAFCNGHPESLKIIPLQQLDQLLKQVVKKEYIEEVRSKILFDYLTVFNYKDQVLEFIKENTNTLAETMTIVAGTNKEASSNEVQNGTTQIVNITKKYYRKKPDLTDTYSATTSSAGGGLSITVPGVILKVDKHTLRTDSIITDTILGQGEALDCFNMRLQNEAALKAELENKQTQLNQAIQESERNLRMEQQIAELTKLNAEINRIETENSVKQMTNDLKRTMINYFSENPQLLIDQLKQDPKLFLQFFQEQCCTAPNNQSNITVSNTPPTA